MAPKKAPSRQGSSKAVGDPSPTSTVKSEISLGDVLSDASPSSKASSKKSSKKKAAEEAKRKAEARKAELKRQQDEAEQQLKETVALKEKILQCAMSAANADNGALGAGFRHSAVLSKDGGLVCFGTSGRSQCDVPHPSVTGYRPYQTLACGHLHTCAATIKGQAVFFGETSFGQCSPPQLGNDVGVTAFCAGYGHSCILDTKGRLHCFGDNIYGQCSVPIELASTTVVSIAAGFRHSCAVTAQGVLLCFGDNSRGQCNVPPSLANVRLVAAGDFHTCAITAEGKLHCFGSNDHGQCNVPNHLEHFIAVTAGSNFTMAILFNGNVWCCGSNGHGQCDLPEHLLEMPHVEEVEVESDVEFSAEEAEEELLETDPIKEVPDSVDVLPTEEPPELPDTDTEANSDMQKRMASTFGSLAESQGTLDTTISSIISEAQESVVDQEDVANRKIKALHEKLAVAWEEAEALAAQYVDRFRGSSAGCFHCCLLQADGQLLFFGDDSANQCTMPEGLVPKVSTVDAAALPLGILADAKPKLLLPPPESEEPQGPPPEAPPTV